MIPLISVYKTSNVALQEKQKASLSLFRLRHVEFGNLAQVFEVDKLKRNEDGITWSVEAHSVEASDFAFN